MLLALFYVRIYIYVKKNKRKQLSLLTHDNLRVEQVEVSTSPRLPPKKKKTDGIHEELVAVVEEQKNKKKWNGSNKAS